MTRGGTETLAVEQFDSTDEQGLPAYQSPVSVTGVRVVRTSEFMKRADGSDVVVTLKAWVPGDAAQVPAERDRVTHDGDAFVVEAVKDGRSLAGALDHVKLMCRDEP